MNSHDAQTAALADARSDAAINWIEPLANWGGLMLLIICMTPCARRVWLDQRIMSGLLSGWSGFIAWTALICIGVPELMRAITGDGRVLLFFPEAKGVIVAAIGGWMSALIVSFVVWTIREFWNSWIGWKNKSRT